jgi:spore coat assembly protein SafA
MNVSIPARISFAPGATQQTLSGRLPAQSHLSYVVRAQANQEMQVSIQPQGQLQLSIYGMDGSVLKSGMGESSSFQGTLPSTQDYILRLSTGDQAVSYQMTVSITGATTLPNTGRRVYTVQLGDTLSQIARRFGVTVNALLQANPQITNPRLLYPGQQIVIP